MNDSYKYALHLVLCVVTIASGCSSSASNGTVQRAIDLDSLVSRCSYAYGVCVLVNAYSCQDCFPVLDSALAILREQDSGACVYAIARAEATAFSRRGAMSRARRAVPAADTVLLDVNPGSSSDPWPPVDVEGGIFGQYGIGVTPALLVVRTSGEVCVVRFEALFGPEGLVSDRSARWNAATLARIIARCKSSP